MKQNYKYGQIQLGESIFVVFIIILLIVFGIVFYSQVQQEDIASEANDFKDLDTITVTQYATSLTELQCSLQEIQYPNCFDITKLTAFEQLVITDREEVAQEFYFSQLGNAKLTIELKYPLDSEDLDQKTYWELYDNPKQDEDGLITTSTGLLQARADLPVSLYDPVLETNAFGILTIIQYR